jgi:hypothetical protein
LYGRWSNAPLPASAFSGAWHRDFEHYAGPVAAFVPLAMIRLLKLLVMNPNIADGAH